MDSGETSVTNRVELHESMKNCETPWLEQMTAEMQSGEVRVGCLLKDEELRAQVSLTVSNLSILSSDLNRFGLLYKPKPPKSAARRLYTGKSEFK